ncbi:hypothetical protein [Polaribacter sp. Hel_I_88]|uniref:hypothetical protein n=1 Tax=Polaribacter sp. Hel_I_88 TaxID=1250006 RepID=UPI00047E0E84|nr:hypothetical protein [Polaribacter sp. Hel_I_88]
MKKLLFIIGIILFNSCTVSNAEEEIIVDPVSAEDRVVRMEFSTTQLSFDEIRISYFDFKTNSYPVVIHQFSYDSAGQPIPFILTIENYDFRYINGEAYRNNPNTEEISVKVYVNDELVIEEAERGEDGEYAEIRFNYDIVLKKNI